MVKRFAVVMALVALVGGLFLPALASAQSAPPSSIIVKLVAGVTDPANVVATNGGILRSSIPALGLHVIDVPEAELADTRARYQADSRVVRAEQNKVRVSESVPGDPLYAGQWALPRIAWDQVFGTVTPTGTAKVAILDTGVDALHPELAGVVVPGTSILDSSNGTTDPSGHGTWLAGIIAAQTGGTAPDGIAGVAYDGVRIMPVTVLNANGEGLDSDVIAGVIWAVDHGADVILMAFSNPGFSSALQEAIDYAWSRGVVLVASAGNNASSTPAFPAGDRGVMGVAATDQNDAHASFSNEGQAVFIAAPGTDIQTTSSGDAYAVVSGTSAAAAHVAGLAAFMKAVDPTLPNGVIVFRIASTADPAGTQIQTGNGRINMARALASTATESIQPAGAAPLAEGGPFVGPYRADGNSTVSGTVRDANTNVAIQGATLSCPPANGCNGSNTTTSAANGTYSLTLQFPGNNATISITASASGYVTQTSPPFSISNQPVANKNFLLVAANTPPTISRVNASVTVNEGATASNSGAWSDANAGDTVALSASVGTVSKSGTNAAGTWSWSFITTDGPAQNQTVTITANDGNGGIATTTFSLAVSNLPPTAAITGAPASSPEGTAINLGSTVTDPSSVDTTAGFMRSWSVTKNGNPFASGGGASLSFTPDDNGTYVLTLSATDKDGGVGTDSKTITVTNVPPTAAITGAPASSPEGTAINLGSTVTDPSSADTTAGFAVAWNVTKNGNPFASGNLASFSFTPNDNGTYVVTLSATDKDGGVGTASTTINVTNVAPTITAVTPSPTSVLVGQAVTFTGTATDPSSEDTAAGLQWAWNAGSAFGAFGAPHANTFTSSYGVCGTYTVGAKAMDKDGGVSAPFTSNAVTVWNGNFLEPLREGTSNLVQKGRVVPVKISFGCGGHKSGLAPAIQLLSGDFVTGAGTESADNYVETLSVSNADTTGIMREVDSKYIYNLAIPNNSAWGAGQPLTIRVSPFGNGTAPVMYILLEIRK